MYSLTNHLDSLNISNIFQPANESNSSSIVILVHGLFTDKHENGRFDTLAEELNKSGFDTLRFDFRGHGESPVASRQFTVAGAIEDLHNILKFVSSKNYKKIHIIASSFGASVTLLYFNLACRIKIDSLVFVNPVVDYKRTIDESKLAWGRDIFSSQNIQKIMTDGFVQVFDCFDISFQFYNETVNLKPFEAIKNIDVPILVFHGKDDEKVPAKISEDYFLDRENIELNIISSFGHGIFSIFAAKKALRKAIKWLQSV